MTPRIGELFAGYGGLGMGVQAVYGGEMAWYSEIDKVALKILEHRFPGVPNLGDVTTVDWSKVEPVDILTGGSPCQDLSHAGKRAGMTEGTRSNLWVAMREAIAVLRPPRVIWENVRGAYTACADSDLGRCPRCVDPGAPGGHNPRLRALGRVLGDLSDLGYDCRGHGIRVSDIGGCHKRFRVFIDAVNTRAPHTADIGHERARHTRDGWTGPTDGNLLPTPRATRGGSNTETVGLLPTPRATDGAKGGPNQRGSSGDMMLPSAVMLFPTPSSALGSGGQTSRSGDRKDEPLLGNIDKLLPTPDASVHKYRVAGDTQQAHSLAGMARRGEILLPTPTVQHTARNSTAGRSEDAKPHAEGDTLADLVFDGRLLPTPMVGSTSPAAHGQISGQWRDQMAEALSRWGDYAPAITRWERIIGRPAPAPTIISKKGTPQLSHHFVEWMMGLPEGHVTDVPGITRNEALKALGNGVVPQQCAAALRTMLAWEAVA